MVMCEMLLILLQLMFRELTLALSGTTSHYNYSSPLVVALPGQCIALLFLTLKSRPLKEWVVPVQIVDNGARIVNLVATK